MSSSLVRSPVFNGFGGREKREEEEGRREGRKEGREGSGCLVFAVFEINGVARLCIEGGYVERAQGWTKALGWDRSRGQRALS